MKTSPCYPSRDQQASLYRGRGIQLPVLPRKKAKKKASYPQGNPHVSGKGIQLPVLRHDKSHSRGKTGEDAGKGIQLPVLLEKKSPHSHSRRCGRPTVRVVYRYPRTPNHFKEINKTPEMRACRCESAHSFHDQPGLFTLTSMIRNPHSESYLGEAPHDPELACEHLAYVERQSSLS